jgi:glycosyltransferase involved in cell wall biosynthesis
MIPKISVIMPMYNASIYVEKTINSILSQTFSDFEFIIVDDMSTDSSFEIVSKIKDSRIKLYKNNENMGAGNTRNIAIGFSAAPIIALTDADDISSHKRLEIQYNFMLKHPEIDVCGAYSLNCDENDKIIGRCIAPSKNEDIRATLFFRNCFLNSSVILKKSIFDYYKYDQNFAPSEDFDLWTKLSSKCKFYNIPKFLVTYRVFENQISQSGSAKQISNARIIQKRNLLELYENLDDCDIEKHFNIFVWKGLFERKGFSNEKRKNMQFKEILEWFDFLLQKNKQKQIYENSAFFFHLQKILFRSLKERNSIVHIFSYICWLIKYIQYVPRAILKFMEAVICRLH